MSSVSGNTTERQTGAQVQQIPHGDNILYEGMLRILENLDRVRVPVELSYGGHRLGVVYRIGDDDDYVEIDASRVFSTFRIYSSAISSGEPVIGNEDVASKYISRISKRNNSIDADLLKEWILDSPSIETGSIGTISPFLPMNTREKWIANKHEWRYTLSSRFSFSLKSGPRTDEKLILSVVFAARSLFRSVHYISKTIRINWYKTNSTGAPYRRVGIILDDRGLEGDNDKFVGLIGETIAEMRRKKVVELFADRISSSGLLLIK